LRENKAHLTKEDIDKILSRNKDSRAVDLSRLHKQGFVKLKDQLEELFSANLEKRMEHKREPEKYFESEGDLHAFLKEIQAIAALPEQVDLFVRSGLPETFLAVLDHQNSDICLECVTLLVELTDEEIAA
jgi:hypothetical protein